VCCATWHPNSRCLRCAIENKNFLKLAQANTGTWLQVTWYVCILPARRATILTMLAIRGVYFNHFKSQVPVLIPRPNKEKCQNGPEFTRVSVTSASVLLEVHFILQPSCLSHCLNSDATTALRPQDTQIQS
jgi:hypothetical protein